MHVHLFFNLNVKPEWTRNAPLRTTSRGYRIKQNGDIGLTSNKLVSAEKPEWVRKIPLRTTSKGERIKRQESLRIKNKPCSHSDRALDNQNEGKPMESGPELAKKPPLPGTSKGIRSKREKCRHKVNTNVEDGVIYWDGPEWVKSKPLRTTSKGKRLQRNQSIRSKIQSNIRDVPSDPAARLAMLVG